MHDVHPAPASIDGQGRPTEVVCALDLGSKNFKLVSGYQANGRVHTKLVDKITLHLGIEINQSGGTIRPEKLAEIETALRTLIDSCQCQGITTILAIATNAISQTTNNNEIVALARKLGIDLEIADGRREGKIGYLAATLGAPNHLVTELGSRSCQIAWDAGARIEVTPLSFGYRRLYEAFFREAPIFDAAAAALRSFLTHRLPLLPRATTALVALASKTLGGFVMDKEKHAVSGTPLTRTAITRKCDTMAQLSQVDFEHFKRQTRKANKILPGLVFMDTMLDKSGHDEVLVVEAELPVGLIVEYFKRDQE